MKYTLLISFFYLAISCSSDYGNKVVGDNFSIYFSNVQDQKLAEKIALYFKDNELISGQKQDVQLTRIGKKRQLRLISSAPERAKAMTFEERKLLTELQTSLYKEVFKEPFDLIICNDKFETIYILNE